MKKVPFATSCPVCAIEVGNHDEPSWAVPAWPADLPAVKAGRPVEHIKPEEWPILAKTCPGGCETSLVGEAVILRRLYMDEPLDEDGRPAYRVVHVFGGVKVRADGSN